MSSIGGQGLLVVGGYPTVRYTLAWITLALALLGSTNCKKKVAPLAPTDTPPVDVISASERLAEADRFFGEGDFLAASKGYEDLLQQQGQSSMDSAAVYRLAVSYALLDDENRSFERSLALLGQLLTKEVDGAELAKVRWTQQLVSLAKKLEEEARDKDSRVKALNGDVERLKKIILEREPSRPPPL